MNDIPATTAPGSLLDNIQTAAWWGLLSWLLDQDEALRQFTADTGIAPPPKGPRSPFDIMIDKACGFDPEVAMNAFLRAFVPWATTTHWGDDGVTPSIRAVLDKMAAGEG